MRTNNMINEYCLFNQMVEMHSILVRNLEVEDVTDGGERYLHVSDKFTPLLSIDINLQALESNLSILYENTLPDSV